MKTLISSDGAVFGPFNSIEFDGNSWVCDGSTVFPKTVVGAAIVEDWIAPPSPPLPPAPVPESITMRQCRLQLHRQGKLSLVQPAIDSIPEPMKTEANIEWEFASVVLRSSPLIAMLAPVLGWDTPEEIDEQFRQASAL